MEKALVYAAGINKQKTVWTTAEHQPEEDRERHAAEQGCHHKTEIHEHVTCFCASSVPVSSDETLYSGQKGHHQSLYNEVNA